MSGLVPLSTMEDDFYIYDEQRNQLIGRRTRRVIRLGDNLEVQVAKVDTTKKQVDFCLSGNRSAAGSAKAEARGASRAPFKTPQHPRQNPFPVSSRQGRAQADRRRRR
jgi:ribonuclease R